MKLRGNRNQTFGTVSSNFTGIAQIESTSRQDFSRGISGDAG
jgi:hypothetical protein